ncbi:MAG: hypothetical protein AB7H77_01825, partial [Bdellovibrionales bacterium]
AQHRFADITGQGRFESVPIAATSDPLAPRQLGKFQLASIIGCKLQPAGAEDMQPVTLQGNRSGNNIDQNSKKKNAGKKNSNTNGARSADPDKNLYNPVNPTNPEGGG